MENQHQGDQLRHALCLPLGKYSGVPACLLYCLKGISKDQIQNSFRTIFFSCQTYKISSRFLWSVCRIHLLIFFCKDTFHCWAWDKFIPRFKWYKTRQHLTKLEFKLFVGERRIGWNLFSLDFGEILTFGRIMFGEREI